MQRKNTLRFNYHCLSNLYTLKKPGAILLNDHQEIVGIASQFVDGNTQIFVRVSEYSSWIETIVWPSKNESTTTEKIPVSSSDNVIISSEQTASPGSENKSTTTEKTPPITDDIILLSQIDDELHDIHIFLNVNLILIMLILFFVLCISGILWSDGLCLRAVLPDRSSTPTSTDV